MTNCLNGGKGVEKTVQILQFFCASAKISPERRDLQLAGVTADTRQLSHDSWHTTAVTRQLTHDSWHRTADTVQLSHDSWHRTAVTRQLAQDSCHTTADTGQLTQDSFHTTADTRQLPCTFPIKCRLWTNLHSKIIIFKKPYSYASVF